VAGFAVAIYLAISFLIILPLLNFLPARFVQDTYGRELTSEIILFNPLKLSIEARQLALPETDGSRFAGFESAEVNLSTESLWHPGMVFDRIGIEGLYLHLRQLPDGSYNFSDLLPAEEQAADDEPDGEIPGVTVRDFAFGADDIRLTNENREQPFSTRYRELAIEVFDLSTVLEDGKPYRLDATGEEGGKLHWEGTLSIPNARSEGLLVLTDISLRTAWRFLEPWVQFELHQGSLDVSGDYTLAWGEDLDYKISDGEARIKNLDITAKEPAAIPDTGLAWQALSFSEVAVDGAEQHVSITDIRLQGLAVQGWMEDDRISLADIFAAGDEVADDPAEAGPSQQEPVSEEAAWTAEVGAVRLEQGQVDWRSPFTDPPSLQVRPIDASAEGLRWPLAGDTDLSVEVAVNAQARASIQGALALADGAGKLGYALEGLPLSWFNPNFPPELKARITDGAVQVKGEVGLAEFAPTQITADGAIKDFAGQVEGEESSITTWETVRWQVLSVDLEQRQISLQQLSIDDYSGRLHIREDGSINTQNVWQEQVGDEAEELAEDLDLDDPWKVDIPAIRVTDSQIDFMDESLPIHFRTVIGDLNGEVLGISTAPGAEAEIDMAGSVDGYAPVALVGTAAPLNTPPALDLTLTFDGVDMALLTPYSGTYAGYAIERGLLHLDLAYSLQEGQLEGNNKVVIEQLKLGDKVDSEQALDLPLELALALLTDINGVIDIALPVSGNLDNPEFDVGGIIADAFINLITKAATAPFALLANLVGAEEDLQRVNFGSGSAELNDAGRVKLDQLSSAMAQRPGITLVIMGRLHPEADYKRLREQQLASELKADGLSQEEIEAKGPDWGKAIRKRYATLPGAEEEATDVQQFKAVRDSVVVPAAAINRLLQDRSVAVKTYLVSETGLGADRAVIEQVSAEDEANQFSGVEMAIET
jgi:hypothetical protein